MPYVAECGHFAVRRTGRGEGGVHRWCLGTQGRRHQGPLPRRLWKAHPGLHNSSVRSEMLKYSHVPVLGLDRVLAVCVTAMVDPQAWAVAF